MVIFGCKLPIPRTGSPGEGRWGAYYGSTRRNKHRVLSDTRRLSAQPLLRPKTLPADDLTMPACRFVTAPTKRFCGRFARLLTIGGAFIDKG